MLRSRIPDNKDKQTTDSDLVVDFNTASSLEEQLTESNLQQTTFTASVT